MSKRNTGAPRRKAALRGGGERKAWWAAGRVAPGNEQGWFLVFLVWVPFPPKFSFIRSSTTQGHISQLLFFSCFFFRGEGPSLVQCFGRSGACRRDRQPANLLPGARWGLSCLPDARTAAVGVLGPFITRHAPFLEEGGVCGSGAFPTQCVNWACPPLRLC